MKGSLESIAIIIRGSIDGSVGLIVAFENSSGIETDETWSFGTWTYWPTFAGNVAWPTEAPPQRRMASRIQRVTGIVV